MIADHAVIDSLIPHKGAMCLLDGIEYHDGQRIICSTMQHRSTSNPLRTSAGLSSLHAIEFAAQAVAVHGGLLATAQARPPLGLLLSARDCRFGVRRIDDIEGPLVIEAAQAGNNDETLLYRFKVTAQDVLLAEGRVTVLLTRGPAP